MKKQMKAIDLHARKLGDEHLVHGAAALVRFWLSPWGLSSWDPCQDAGTKLPNASARLLLIKKLSRFHPKRFRNAPEGQDRRIALAELEAADVSSINTHSLGSPALRTMRVPRQAVPTGRAGEQMLGEIGRQSREEIMPHGPTSPWTVRYRGTLAD